MKKKISLKKNYAKKNATKKQNNGFWRQSNLILFPYLLEDYKAELLDKVSMVKFLPYAVHTDLGRDEDVKEDSHSASVNANIPI